MHNKLAFSTPTWQWQRENGKKELAFSLVHFCASGCVQTLPSLVVDWLMYLLDIFFSFSVSFCHSISHSPTLFSHFSPFFPLFLSIPSLICMQRGSVCVWRTLANMRWQQNPTFRSFFSLYSLSQTHLSLIAYALRMWQYTWRKKQQQRTHLNMILPMSVCIFVEFVFERSFFCCCCQQEQQH